MFEIRKPLFRVDEGEMNWEGFFESEPNDTQVNDDQPEGESETETPEEGEQETSTSDDSDDSDKDEDSDDADEDEKSDEDDDSDEPPFNDDTDIQIGEGQVVKLGELKQGYLRQADYTRKTQALADERKTFEAEREHLQPVKQMSDFLNANPYLREQIQEFIREFTTTGIIPIQEALQDAQYGQYINTLMAQNQQLQQELQEARMKNGELEFTGSMRDLKSQLKAEYGELATDEYLASLEERAKNEKLPSNVLKEIADAHLAKLKLEQEQKKSKKLKKETETKTYQKMREKADSIPANPRKKGQVPNRTKTSDPYEPMDWDDIF